MTEVMDMECIVVDRFPEIIQVGVTMTELAVHDAAANIVSDAKTFSRVESGEMRDGWEYKQIDLFTFEVLNMVEHTIYNEYGTEYMSAQPMLHPAIEKNEPHLLLDVAAAWSHLV